MNPIRRVAEVPASFADPLNTVNRANVPCVM
jgi:hypothetical protein